MTSFHTLIYDRKTKELFSFGRNNYCQLGLSNDKTDFFQCIPHKIPFFNNEEILQIALGAEHTLILTKKGLFSFGRNAYGQLGLSNKTSQSSPQKVTFFEKFCILEIATGLEHSLVFASNGLFSFGKNNFGQLGLNHTVNQNRPQRVSFFDKHEILQISTGCFHSFVLTNKGLFGFGRNDYGQLGLGHNSSQRNPQRISFFDHHQILQISAGSDFSCVLSLNGLFSFGRNKYGQLGLPNKTPQKVPQKIPFFDKQEILQLSAGGFHCLALTKTGLFCWGQNALGQLGLSGLVSFSSSIPNKNDFFTKKDQILQIFTGVEYSLVLTSEGLFSFGSNAEGQLGLSNTLKSQKRSENEEDDEYEEDEEDEFFTYFFTPQKVTFFNNYDPHNLFIHNENFYLKKIKKERRSILLLSRTFDKNSVFYKDFLPLDLFKLILKESNLL